MTPPVAHTAALSQAPIDFAFLSGAFERLTQTLTGPRSVDHDLSLNQALALLRQAEHIIAWQRTHIERLETLSLTDDLTGLLNRRGFMQALAREAASVRRYGDAALVIAIDLDGFKAINDRYGHGAGDFVLTQVARRLTGALRDTDVVARLGGDEFACLLSRCASESVEDQVERLRAAIEIKPLKWGSESLSIGASIGLARVGDGTDDDLAAVLANADSVMYRDKSSRRSLGRR